MRMTMTHEEVMAELMQDPEFRAAYEAYDPEIAMLDARLAAREARTQAKLTQAEVAKRMGTKREAIARFESRSAGRSSTLGTLCRYAAAVNCRLKISFEPVEPRW